MIAARTLTLTLIHRRPFPVLPTRALAIPPKDESRANTDRFFQSASADERLTNEEGEA
jgi:hypothetical protein